MELNNERSVFCAIDVGMTDKFAAFYVRCERWESALQLYRELLLQLQEPENPTERSWNCTTIWLPVTLI